MTVFRLTGGDLEKHMPVPVLSVAQMRQWEQASWDAGRSVSAVIHRVGQAVAEKVMDLTRAGNLVVILAGKGHNGDDGRAAALLLSDREVELCEVFQPKTVLQQLEKLIARKPAILVDALFGIGLDRQLDADWTELIELLNRSNIPILSVDVPSGLNADTGETEGIGLYAHTTLTIGAPKRGLLKSSAYPFVGRLEVATDVGLIPCPHTSEIQWTIAEDFDNFPPVRRVDAHKGIFGHVAIVAGSVGYAGAAVLSGWGALRARPGLVSIFCPEAIYPVVATQMQAAMVHPWHPSIELPDSCSALVIGPGLADPKLDPKFREWTNEMWKNYPLPVLVDASALDWLEQGATPLNSRRVMTPHPGEAARMLGTKPSIVQENRVEAVRELSSRYGNCWVVLKGHQTLVGRANGEVFVNPSGNPFLAQGGSGDTLVGFLGGLFAQSRLQPHPLRTLRYGVWEHGATADRLSQGGKIWTISDLAANLGDISAARREQS
ncbi:MAG: NAD(P)H-hydrate dehydratase [Verrucomicrobiales bacterium]